jgi:hypothetical protein
MEKLADPILITGCARSGTSMVAGIINICGAFGGEMSGPNKNNQKGMFENAYIRNSIVKPYLQQIEVDRLGQYPLPDITNMPIPTDWRRRVEQVMLDQGYQSGLWMYKGAKMCLMWPVWHYAFPDAKWIIVRRKTGDIINSCKHTAFMRAFNNDTNCGKVGAKTMEEGWLWWVHQHEQRFIEMITEGLNCKIVWPHRMVTGDYKQIYETIEWLGLKWTTDALTFVDPQLWHARRYHNKEKQAI